MLNTNQTVDAARVTQTNRHFKQRRALSVARPEQRYNKRFEQCINREINKTSRKR